MRRYIFVLPCFYATTDSRSTGGTISNFLMAQVLARQGQVDVIAPRTQVTDDLPTSSFNVHAVDRAELKGGGKLLRGHRLKKKLYSEIHNQDIDTVVFFGGGTNFLANSFCKMKNVKVVLLVRAYDDFVYGSWSPINNRKKWSMLKRLIDFGRTKRSFLEASGIITNSDWMVSCIKKSFPFCSPVRRLYPALDLNVKPSKSKGNVKASFNVGVVCRGSGEDKGLPLVIRLAKRNLDISFNIYGNLCPRKVQFDVPNNVHLRGWAPRELVYTENDLFLVPSTWPEPFGRVAIEAQAYGVPVLVSDVGGLSETVLNPVFLVKDEEEWHIKINNCIENYAFWKTQSNNYSESVVEKFSPESNEKELLKIIAEF